MEASETALFRTVSVRDQSPMLHNFGAVANRDRVRMYFTGYAVISASPNLFSRVVPDWKGPSVLAVPATAESCEGPERVALLDVVIPRP